MPGTPFSATRREQDGHTILALRGDINRNAQEGLQAAYAEAKGGPGSLLFDFREVDYINSTGIALIVGLLAAARAAGRTVAAYGLTDHYREIFTITRLSDFMTLHADHDAALAAH